MRYHVYGLRAGRLMSTVAESYSAMRKLREWYAPIYKRIYVRPLDR